MEKNQQNTQFLAKKITNSEINQNGKTNVRKIMETIYGFSRPIKVQDIVRDTGFTQKQVLNSLDFMSSVGMITKSYENLGAKHKVPPRRNLIISLSKSQFEKARRFLSK